MTEYPGMQNRPLTEKLSMTKKLHVQKGVNDQKSADAKIGQ